MKIGKYLDNNTHTKLDITRNGGLSNYGVYETLCRTYGPGAYNKFADAFNREPIMVLRRIRYSIGMAIIESIRREILNGNYINT